MKETEGFRSGDLDIVGPPRTGNDTSATLLFLRKDQVARVVDEIIEFCRTKATFHLATATIVEMAFALRDHEGMKFRVPRLSGGCFELELEPMTSERQSVRVWTFPDGSGMPVLEGLLTKELQAAIRRVL